MTVLDEDGTVITTKTIPRHKVWNGPLVMPDGPLPPRGDVVCHRCERRWATPCTCQYYKRCTTYIDVLQDEFALKAYDRRMVAYGMSKRKDLVLAANACENNDTLEDKKELQRIADTAKEVAMASSASNIGTALHKFTERLDTGKPLGVDDDVSLADVRAYEQCTAYIEWVAVESFRVNDDHMVGGTADRIGWYRGRLHIFDLKTSPKDNAVSYPHGPAMQLAMYAHSVPYDIVTDTRGADPMQIDLNVAYIIALPAGSGKCRLVPVDIDRGWHAVEQARNVWNWRGIRDLILTEDIVARMYGTLIEQASVATSINRLRKLWEQAYYAGELTPEFLMVATARADVLKG